MKVYADKLSADLKSRLHPLYIVSGDEQLLVQEATDQIRSALKIQGYLERELFHAEAGFDWSSLLYGASSMSLFAEKKLIEVRLPGGKPGDQGSRALIELAGQLNEDTILLLILPRVGQDVQRTKWFKTLETAGAFIQVWPVEARELPRWLDARFRKAGLKATREAVQVMADRIEGNLLAAVQEIERLALISEDGRVDVHQVVDGVADSARYDVFKLIDAAMAGHSARAARMTAGLRAEGVEVMFVIAMLARELRTLEVIASGMEKGQSKQAMLKTAKVWKNRQSMVSGAVDRLSLQALRRLVGDIGRIDRTVKGIESGNPWRLLEDIILGLSGRSILGGKSLNA